MRLRRSRSNPPIQDAGAATRRGLFRRGTYSLFGEILDWMLAPLLFLWPISIIVTYDVASRIADQPYDKALGDQVRALAGQVHVLPSGAVRVDLPASALRVLRTDTEDTVYFQIVSPRGTLLAGDAEVPSLPEGTRLGSADIQYRDDAVQGEDIRVAYMPVFVDQVAGTHVLVQVAETRHKRDALSSRIVSGVLLPQFAIIPLAVVLVWFGLSRGIAPLNRLQSMIRERRPGDLSPVAEDSVPEEVRPVVMAFNDMMARLEDNLHAQRRFIADAAHQMRTPIAGLKMQMELARQEAANSRAAHSVRRSIEQAEKGAERAARLINQLLALARAESSSEKVNAFERLEMNGLVREVLGDYVPIALARDIDLGAEMDDQPVWLEATPIMLFELVSNLVDNAVKYTPSGGTVTVSVTASDADGMAVLRVRDNGPGVPEEERERIFERFYRVLGTGAEGSGLGLSIVREIAELHGGTVTLNANEDGIGTVVTVRLPLPAPQ
ncbi:MAG: sensor histidine kinase N-terminal domain-containing protein [Rhodocyclaceae bacterium]